MLATMIFSFSWSLQLSSVQEQDNAASMQSTVKSISTVRCNWSIRRQTVHDALSEPSVHMISRYIGIYRLKADENGWEADLLYIDVGLGL